MKVQGTFAMQATSGFVIPLTDENGNAVTCRYLNITVGAECRLKAINVPPGQAAPTAPAANPVPAAGTISPYFHLVSGVQTAVTLDWAKGKSDASNDDAYTHIVGYSVGAGDLLVTGN